MMAGKVVGPVFEIIPKLDSYFLMTVLQKFELFFGHTDGRTANGRTDGRGSRNSYLDWIT